MSWHYFDIKFGTLGQLSSELGVIFCVLPLDFPRFFSFISYVFITIQEKSNKISFVTNHKVKVIYLSIDLISSLVLNRNY